ncbi:MAG: sugar-binding protein [Armatimonadetes bacterium]|nr:sugar-binding protein [Armatimonadota bacterium]
MKRICLWILACLLALSALSCGKQTGGKGDVPSVAFVTNNVSDFWMIAKAGVAAGEKDFNVKCEFRMPPQGTSAEQKQIIEDLLVKGVTGIAISPRDPANQTDVLNTAARSVNLICMDSDAPKSERICYVGTDNYNAGRAAGDEIKKALPNGGKVLLFVGTLDAQNAADRKKGIEDAVKGSKVQIIGTLTDNTDHAKAKSNVEDAMVKYPDIAGFMGLWSYNGPAIAEAVKSSGKAGKIRIVCFDEEAATLQGVKDGVVFSTVVQKPYQFGYESMRILAALARGEDAKIPENKVVDTGVRVISRANVDSFWAELKKMTGR